MGRIEHSIEDLEVGHEGPKAPSANPTWRRRRDK